MPFPFAAVAAGLAPIIGGLIANKGGKNQNQANVAQQRLANEHNEKMWRLQNDYNNPMAQMQRLREAGLNPNLVYGQGSKMGEAGSVAPAKAAHQENTLSDMGKYASLSINNAPRS